MSQTRVLILIPSRYDSSRFPGKPLMKIEGMSMIERVHRGCQSISSREYVKNLIVETCVVTDDERIEKHVKGFGGRVLRVDDDVSSGTERIFLAYKRNYSREDYDFILNVQGDEPLLEGEDLLGLIAFHLQHSHYKVTTLVRPLRDFSEFTNPDRVKVAFSRSHGRCLYFSRAPIPFDREGDRGREWFLHIGIYCYTPWALCHFSSLEEAELERIERLEQLRILNAGMDIGAALVEHELVGVDRPEDIEKVEILLRERGRRS